MDPNQIAKDFEQLELFETGLTDYHSLLRHMCDRPDLDPSHSTVESLSQDIYLLHPRRHAGVPHGPPILYFDETKYGLRESTPATHFGHWGCVYIEADKMSAVRKNGPGEFLRVLPGVVLGPQYAHPEESLVGMLAMAELATS